MQDKIEPMAEDADYQKLQSIYLDWHNGHRPLSGFIRELEAYTTNKIIEELEHLLRISHQSNRVPIIEGWAENRIAELKALNHRKDD